MDRKLYGVLACFDEYTERCLAEMQQKLYNTGFVGEQTRNIPMHITLGLYDKLEDANLKELAARAADKTSFFNVTFSHVGVFQGGKTLFAAPDINRELLNLKEFFGGSINWTPHATLLIDTPETIYKALPVILDSFKAFTGRIEYISIYEFWPAELLFSVRLSSKIGG